MCGNQESQWRLHAELHNTRGAQTYCVITIVDLLAKSIVVILQKGIPIGKLYLTWTCT